MKDRVLRISILTLLAVFFIVAKPQAQEQATNPIIVKTEVVFSDGTAKLGELTLDQFPKLHDCVVQQSLDCTLLLILVLKQSTPCSIFSGQKTESVSILVVPKLEKTGFKKTRP